MYVCMHVCYVCMYAMYAMHVCMYALYVRVQNKKLGAITPLGGAAFIAGW